MIKPRRFKAIISKKEKISSKVYDVRFKLVDPVIMEYRVGHTIMIYVTPGVNRSMSIASPPKENSELTMCWDVSPMGPGCQWLLARNVGDSVEFMGPLGAFLYDSESPRKSVFIGTGTGVAPYKAALEEFGAKKPVSLYFGLRHEEDIFWNDRFEEFSKLYPSFQYKLILSQPKEDWKGRKGHVEDYIFAEEQDLFSCDFYLCGSGRMVAEMSAKLEAKGIPKEHIKKELFFKQ
jgi:CDP-4-dehydro-6-deoxyglucose reductase